MLQATVNKILTLLGMGLILTGCIEGPEDNAQKITLSFQPIHGSDVKGTISIIELENGTTRITIEADGIFTGNHPVHVHNNTVAEGGSILITLNDLDQNGRSITDLIETDAGNPVSFEDFLDLEGHINISESETNPGEYIARADIGQNAMTGRVLIFDLSELAGSGIKGQAAFQQRLNNTTLVTLILENTASDQQYPALIREGSVDNTGDISITLNPVDGASGLSYTQVEGIDSPEGDPNQGEPISYNQLANYDGHIVVASPVTSTLQKNVATGNIGKNAISTD